MKNKLMYLVAVLFAACVGFSSCSDDDDKVDETLTGTWNYGTKGDVYFNFEYAEDYIEIHETALNMFPDKIKTAIITLFPNGKIPVASIEQILVPYAKQQMQKYFRGIDFISNTELEILITVEGQDQKIKTTYEIQGPILSISTQSENFKDMTNNMIPTNVKSIDLNYFFKDNELTLYVNTTYAQNIISMLPTILVNTGVFPEPAKPTISQMIASISNKINKLEFGPVLVR